MKKLTFILLLFLSAMTIGLVVVAQSKAEDTTLPRLSDGWSDSEKAQFGTCVSRISDRQKENSTQLSADRAACLFFEEREHWMNLHPEARGKKEDHRKFEKCSRKSPMKVHGTPEEFHASFDVCMCAAYGIHKQAR